MSMEKITTEDNEFVTKGFLKQEFEKFMKAMLEQFTDLNTRFEKNTDLVVKEIHTMRAEMREFHQTKDALQRSDIIQERRIEDLEERVLVLETAK